MSTRTERGERHPFWAVHAIVDPRGRDHLYTSGLADAGVPELHVWATPCDQPDAAWRLGMLDAGLVLNRLAGRLLAGELEVGDTWEEPFDDGRVIVAFRVDPAVPAGELGAEHAGDAVVLPVRWQLQRAMLGTEGG